MQRCHVLAGTGRLHWPRPRPALQFAVLGRPRQFALSAQRQSQGMLRTHDRILTLSGPLDVAEKQRQPATSDERNAVHNRSLRTAPTKQSAEKPVSNIAPLLRRRSCRQKADGTTDQKRPSDGEQAHTAGKASERPPKQDSNAVVKDMAAAVQDIKGTQIVPAPSSDILQEPPAARAWRLYSKPAALIFASAHVLATACAVTGVAASPPWLPPTVGAGVGSLFAALNRYGVVRFWRAPKAPLRVVITGSTKGLGKALAREFLRSGDRVIVTARSTYGVRNTVAELRQEMGPDVCVTGMDVDVSSPASVARLADRAKAHFGDVDVWVNNAGYSGSFQSLVDARPQQIVEVVTTNLLGALLCTRAAVHLMGDQKTAGHVFNVDGAGADGMPTPNYAAYGATKTGIAHMMGSLKEELAQADSLVSVHTISPGMVLTGLLLSGATIQNKRVFNILCEQPETVAAYLVPRMRTAVARGGNAQYIRYLTPARAMWFFLNAPFRARRFFDAKGEQLYADEYERMFGAYARRTQRLAEAAARRTSTLGLVYSLSLSMSYLLISLFGSAASKLH